MTEYPTSKIIMYVQQLDHLPFENLEALDTRIKQLDYLKRYAWIVHDKDVAEDGSKVSPHVHVTFEFSKPIPLNKLARALNNEKPNYFQKMTRRGQSAQASATNAFRYLVHRTKKAQGKYQYDPKGVHANFRYAEFLEKTKPKENKRAVDNQKINELLALFAKGQISKEQLIYEIYKIDPLQAGSRMKQIEKLDEVRNVVKGHEWKQRHREKVVLWFYGSAGTGKTSEAKHILGKKFDEGYFVSGGDRDLFESYSNQHGILLDDLRSTSMAYDEILRMLDPYNLEVEVGSRYHNKQIQGEIYIITCPLSPYKFYKGMQEVQGLDLEDSYDQLGRRINMVVHFSKGKIKIENPNQEEQTVIDEIDNPIEESMEAMYKVTDEIIRANFGKKFEKDMDKIIDYKVVDGEVLAAQVNFKRIDEYMTIPFEERDLVFDPYVLDMAYDQLEQLDPKDPSTRSRYERLQAMIDELSEEIDIAEAMVNK